MWYERNNELIWETCKLFRYADGSLDLIIFTYTHAQSKCPLCRSFVTSPAICHWEDVWIWFKRSWQLSTHLWSACSKTFIPISSFCASNSWELWNFGKKAIQWLDLLWKINSWDESKNVYPSLVESILMSNITCNLKARNKTLTRVADIAKISKILWKIAVRHIHNTTRFLFSCSAKSNYESY